MNDPTPDELLTDEALARFDRRLDELIHGATLGSPAFESYSIYKPVIWPPNA